LADQRQQPPSVFFNTSAMPLLGSVNQVKTPTAEPTERLPDSALETLHQLALIRFI